MSAVLCLLLALYTASATFAQVSPEAPKTLPTEQQSATNPFPRGNGDAQNQGRAVNEFYFGVTNGNVPWNQYPLTRVNNELALPRLLELDGWSFDASARNDGRRTFINGVFQGGASLTVPLNASTPNSYGATHFGNIWTQAPQNAYFRAIAANRPNVDAQNIPAVNKFVWNTGSPAIPAGRLLPPINSVTPIPLITTTNPYRLYQQTRFSLRFVIPNATDVNESRVTDARYVVYYYVLRSGSNRTNPSSFIPKRKVYTLSQLGNGEFELINADGNPAFVPFFTGSIVQTATGNVTQTMTAAQFNSLPAQPGLGFPFQGVVLDNTSENAESDGFTQPYVIAAQMRLVSSVDAAYVTPTILPPHGGRIAANSPGNYNNPDAYRTNQRPVPALVPYSAGTQPIQPPVGVRAPDTGTVANNDPGYRAPNAYTGNTTTEAYNNSPDFINNPFDARYTTASNEAYGRLESWNPSVLFRGPESLIDPRLGNRQVSPGLNRPLVPARDPVTGQQLVDTSGNAITRRAAAVDADNHSIYRTNLGADYNLSNNPAVPFFSHFQVILARTEYIPNPETGVADALVDGTLTLPVGAIYCVDGTTGAPLWRFPDRTYALYTDNQGRVVSGDYRNNNDVRTDRSDDPLSLGFQPAVPGIRAVDKNEDGVIADDEVFIVGEGGNGSGGLFAAVTFAPRVPVRGEVELPMYDVAIPSGGNAASARTVIRARRASGTSKPANAVKPAPPGRYYAIAPDPSDPTRAQRDSLGRPLAQYDPVEVGVLYVAAANGVIYALDAFGNNDNDYYPNALQGSQAFGTFRPGTTNVLWTFNATYSARPTNASGNFTISEAEYYKRIRSEIPATASFGTSAPVLAYQRDDRDTNPANYTDAADVADAFRDPYREELRLFIGNSNGYLYALQASADAGRRFNNLGGTVGVGPLPHNKSVYTHQRYVAPTDPTNPGQTPFVDQTGVRWWFRARNGGVDTSLAVSKYRQDAGENPIRQTPNAPQTDKPRYGAERAEKGIFAVGRDGYVYSLDWTGPISVESADWSNGARPVNYSRPVTDGSSSDRITFGGEFLDQTGNAAIDYDTLLERIYDDNNQNLETIDTVAEVLNDDFYQHNVLRTIVARVTADRREGQIRPRWTFPNLYQDIDGERPASTGSGEQTIDQEPDIALVNPRPRLDDPSRQIAASGTDGVAGARLVRATTTLGPITTPPVLMDFSWVNPDGVRVLKQYVVVQADDAVQAGLSPRESRLYLLDQVGDRVNFLTNPSVRQTGSGTATTRQAVSHPRDRWTPGFLLGDGAPVWAYRPVYETLDNDGDRTSRDMDLRNNYFPQDDDNNDEAGRTRGLPGRKLQPTLYIAGVGQVFAIDIDKDTGLLARHRPNMRRSSGTANSLRFSADLTVWPNIPGMPTTDAAYRQVTTEAAENILSPLDPVFEENDDYRALQNRQILARVAEVYANGGPAITAMTITAGPLQNRSGQTDNLNQAAQPFVIVPGAPTNDPVARRPDAIPSTNSARDNGGPPPYDVLGGPDAEEIGVTFAVNQDINDPLTTTEGAISSDPNPTITIPNTATDPANRKRNQAFQYPLLLVSDAGGALNAVSSNTEGEDRTASPSNPRTGTFTIGWPILGVSSELEYQWSERHALHFGVIGPGGTSGVAAITNAYFPALDPNYVNPYYEEYYRANPPRPTTPPFVGRYPFGEPNTIRPTPYKVQGATNDPPNVPAAGLGEEPRPDFKPRSFSSGIVAGATVDPDNNPTTDNNITIANAVPADRHTGQSGFPLNLNGLFFDKRFAGQNGARADALGTTVGDTPVSAREGSDNTLQHPNGSYRNFLRLPGYSFIGGAIDAASFNNQVPDGARADLNGGVLAPGNDDINPAAQNVTWLFAGGQGGLLYAYTPAVTGQASGYVGGLFIGRTGDPLAAGNPIVAIVNRATYEAVVADAADGTLSANTPDIIQQGSVFNNSTTGRALYEWGEQVYILVYNLIGNTAPTGPNGLYATTNTVNLVFERRETNDRAANAFNVELLPTGNANKATYVSGTQPLGVAAYTLDLSAPTPENPLTPGDLIAVRAQPQGIRSAQGRQIAIQQSTVQTAETEGVYFGIANPLAVQAYLTNTGGRNANDLRLLGVPVASGDTQNGIGPFIAEAAQTTVKARLAGSPVVAGTNDPNRNSASYSQAMTNGNTVTRTESARFDGSGNLNSNFRGPLRTSNGEPEPTFYFPVIAGASYINDNERQDTDIAPGVQTLRIANRSLARQLPNVIVQATNTLVWQTWPGRVPNALVDAGNPRLTPTGMDPSGRINPLPWEDAPLDPQLWNRASLNNPSRDYPDIPIGNDTLQVFAGGVDLTKANGALAATVQGTGDNRVNTAVAQIAQPNVALAPQFATRASVKVPQYQPANLVATHSLTSPYLAPSRADGTNLQLDGNEGPVQLPRPNGNNVRFLRELDNNGNFTNNAGIAPAGYTTRMIVVAGTAQFAARENSTRNRGFNPNDPRNLAPANSGGAYREFEVTFGVPIRINLRAVGQSQGTIDLGKLPHSFGMQNGLLGYEPGAIDPAFVTGFLPDPLRNTSLFSASAPYSRFFKQFNVQSDSNINLYNLRVSQRTEVPGPATTVGSGFPYAYVGMQSATVNRRFGILAAGADPRLAGGTMPQIVTSLDNRFDAAWNQFVANDPLFGPASDPASPYTVYYQAFGGRHTLHKPLPGESATTLTVPDKPRLNLRPLGTPQPQPNPSVVGVAIPLGTPIGTYKTEGASLPLVIFEDHDTNVNYNPLPYVTGTNTDGTPIIAPAGPLYAGTNSRHPGANPLRIAGGAAGEGIWRVRRVDAGRYEYLPATDISDSLRLKVDVTEAPLTGDVADRALPDAGLNLAANVVAGRLPGIDLFPLVDRTAATVIRPTATLTPAAYRSINGGVHVFFARNYAEGATGGFAQPGQPFHLFHSHLTWNAALGTWQAAAPGVPLANATNNSGRWFSAPVQIPNVSGEATESNTSPFVLQLTGRTAANEAQGGVLTFADTATLFWLNSVPRAGGTNYNRIVFQQLNANGIPTGNPQLFLQNLDPAVPRYAPKAIYLPSAGRTFVFYYGGAGGRFRIYYGSREANTSGFPTGTAPNAADPANPQELPLPLPAAILSATDPAPVLRRVILNGTETQVLDVFFSGVTRGTNTSSLYMIRVRPEIEDGQLRLVSTGPTGVTMLTPVLAERLSRNGATGTYSARHIAWYRNLNNRNLLPIIAIDGTVVTTPNAWQEDTASGLLYQSFDTGVNETIVYVDPDTGTVRFRGRRAPGPQNQVQATYQPQIYRVTTGGTASTAPFVTMDTSFLPAINPATLRDTVIARRGAFEVGRQWLVWQRGASSNKPATLLYTARRVGIDLRATTTTGDTMNGDQSIGLSPPDPTTRNQEPIITVAVNGVAVPHEVDYINGRVYVEQLYEGQTVTVEYTRYTPEKRGANGQVQQASATEPNRVAEGILGFIAEGKTFAQQPNEPDVIAAEVSLGRSVNESMPYTFLDLFNPYAAVSRPAGDIPLALQDPVLTPGRLWLFWSSPRARTGTQPGAGGQDLFPTGYDLYWQTLAPDFDGQVSGGVQSP